VESTDIDETCLMLKQLSKEAEDAFQQNEVSLPPIARDAILPEQDHG
jgi:hypothetical protein